MTEEVKKEFKLTFDTVFKRISTEKSTKIAEASNILVCIAKKHIRKNLAKVLFQQKFGVKAEHVNSSAVKKIVKTRTKTKKSERTKVLKKFFFKLPKDVTIPE